MARADAPTRPNPFAQLRYGLLLNRDMPRAVQELHGRYGDVVDIGLGPQRFVFLFGPAANRLILHDRADNFLWGPLLQSLVPIDGATALVVTDGPEHDRRKKIVQPAFHVRRINGYLHTMLAETDATIDGLSAGTTADVHAAFRACIRRIVLRCLMGETLAADADALGDELEAAIEYVQRSPATRLDHRVFPPFRRAMAARAAADTRIHAEIERRRVALAAGEPAGDDVLTWLLTSTDDAGAPLTDTEIRDQVVSLVAAGYDTTSAAVGWTLHAVHAHPEVRDAIAAEVAGLDDWADAAALNALPTLHGAVQESLRLWPPGPVSGRQAIGAFDFAGARIPAGRKVIYSAYVTHHDAEVFDDPEAFRPERWTDGADRDAYAFVPFGGGPRRCIGHAFATLEIKAIVARFVSRVSASTAAPTPSGAGIATWAPSGGVTLAIDSVV